MLKFVEKWFSERYEPDQFPQRQVGNSTWVKCENGLPDSDRDVEVVGYNCSISLYRDPVETVGITTGSFTPHKGWTAVGDYKKVLMWKEIDIDLKRILKEQKSAK